MMDMARDVSSAERAERSGMDVGSRQARRYLAAFVIAAFGSIGAFYGGLVALQALDRLPPTPVAGTWCIDSRFEWLRDHRDWTQAGVLAIGSSTTWRNLDFSAIPARAREEAGGVVNVAPCFLNLNQTRFLSEFFAERAPRMQTVLTVIAPRDFEQCGRVPAAFFDPDVATRFVAGEVSPWWLHFRNLRAGGFFNHVMNVGTRRDELVYDAFGSGPLTRAVPDTGRPFRPEPTCYSELTRMAHMLAARNVQLIVVTVPIMGAWARLHDPAGETCGYFKASVEAALAGTRAILVDGLSEFRVPDDAFTDPVHLQWHETAPFTRFVWQRAIARGARLPALDGERRERADADHGKPTPPQTAAGQDL